MRKLIVIFSLFCYLAATIGLSFSLNYCDGKLTGISFDCIAIRCCCDEEINKDCCDGKVIKIEKADDHNRLTENLSQLKISCNLPEVLNSFPGFDIPQYDYQAQHQHQLRPPQVISPKFRLYILHSDFRI